jgi:hypothetical protein
MMSTKEKTTSAFGGIGFGDAVLCNNIAGLGVPLAFQDFLAPLVDILGVRQKAFIELLAIE